MEQASGERVDIIQAWRHSSHPIAIAAHVSFKFAVILIYLLGTQFKLSSLYLVRFLLCINLAAADFWIVKNITGRFLVRLRWWNEESSTTGENEWQFMYDPDRSSVTKTDEGFFWNTMYLSCGIWVVFSLASLLRWNLEWVLLSVLIMSMNWINLLAYWKCHWTIPSQRDSSLLNQWFSNAVMSNLVNRFQSIFKKSTSPATPF